MLRKLIFGAVTLTSAIGLVGCGGSGGGGSSAGSGGGGTASSMFLTADPNPNYSHVWVNVTNVGLVSSTGQTTTVYNGSSTGGQVVDLSSLNASGSQQFMLLTGFGAPPGTFKSATITVSSTASVVQSGSSSAISATFAGSKNGSAILTATFSSAQNIASMRNVALDFSLGSWTLSGSTLSATGSQYIQLGSTLNLNNPNSILSGDYFGSVSGLAGSSPNQTFSISSGRFAVNVSTSSSTTLFNSDGSANPTLSNGETVDVAGTFDVSTNTVDATAIVIQVSSQSLPPVRVNGIVTADNEISNTLTLQLAASHGYLPVTSNLTVNVNSSTMFFDSSGVTDTEAQFFSSLTLGTNKVQVEGTVSGGVFTATSAQILPSTTGTQSALVAVRGEVSNINATADSFTLTVSKWEGKWLPKNTSVSIVTTADTQFAVDGTVENAATFFATLPVSLTVNVRGTLDPTTLTLTAAIVTQGPADGFGFHF